MLTSPFARAKETATIISKELSIRLEEDLYLKERNTYGLMCGVSKDVMKNEYPELYEIYLRAGDMPGAEKYEDFVIRIKRLMAKLLGMKDQNIVCVTHGHLMTVMINEVFGEKKSSVSNGGGFVVEFEKNKWKMIEKWGISKYSGKYWK